MPAIRDTSFAYESVTTDAGITLPMCAYGEGDLLFAIAACDVAVTSWGCSNGVGTWNLLVDVDNSAGLAIFWKYAAASGEGDVVITANATDTYSGALIAVRDVYQGYTSGSPPLSASTTSTGTRIALPTLTTSSDNSLVLAVISSTATAPSIFFAESVLQDLVKVDGSAEGLGVGWFFRRSAGLTPTYYAGAVISGNGNKVVIECRAPLGGAAVIPTYPVSDASILLTPAPSSAWDGNTAMAATADTNFGTSIAGRECRDATVGTAADIGIDRGAFMPFSGLTNAAAANTMSGAEVVVAASRYNVGARNILGHFRHPTPAHNQRLSPVTSGRGVWMAMKSGATAGTNYKVWQVHGGDVSMPPGYVMPIVINASNSDHVAEVGTLDTTDVRRYGFWSGGIGALTQQACFGPLWAMDTCVLAGGTASEPIDAVSIVAVAARNKLRFSSILQGANQMLCLQAIQFGSGGANPTYLRVNAAAIEFPSKRDVLRKLVNYNGIDNSVGWTFYPGAGDTIDLEGTSFASASPFHWRIHASASASATYNFTGVVINGAGDVTLQPVTTFTGMTFSRCLAITQNGAAISDCTFLGSKVLSSSLGALSNISGCSFTSTGTGHAIEVTGSAGTITFTGNEFEGYAATNGSTGNEAIYVNIASGTVTINIAGGGTTPSIRTAGATVVVNNSVSLSLTGIVPGSDIVILNAGTTVERANADEHSSSTYVYSYSDPGAYVDVCVYKQGYVPYTVRNYQLPASDASLPIAQAADRNFSNP